MKLLKTIVFLSSAVFCLSANADVAKKDTKDMKETKIKVQQPQKEQVSELQRFTDTMALSFVGAVLEEKENQQVLTFKYQLENKSAKDIKMLHWATYYTYGDKVLLTQDIPIAFDNGFKSKQVIPMDFSIPWENLSQEMQQVILDEKKELSAQYQAKTIEFTDGSKIIVK